MKKYISYLVLLFLGFSLGLAYPHIIGKDCLEQRKQHKKLAKKHKRKDFRKDPSLHFINKLSKKLDLTEEQKNKALVIFKAQHKKMEGMRKKVRPQFKSIKDETFQKISAILDQEQKEIFKSIRKKIFKNRRPPRYHRGLK